MSKKALSESDICDKFIRPAMESAGWDGMSQIYREYPLRAGRVIVRGRRARRDASTVLRADYALFFKTNIPLAVVEAKDNNHAMGAGMAQAIKGDLIYPRYGTIGNVRMVTTDQAFLASYSCAVIKVLHGYIDARFQYLVSISEHIRQQARGATNRTTQPNVGLKSIQQFVFPLPPLAEQARIVGRVTELRRLCSDLRHRLERSSATQAALADTLVEQSLVA